MISARQLFAHPNKRTRLHHPQGYEDYGSFKPWLRDEFEFRCVYCLIRECWYPNGADSFSVEHVIPQKGEFGDPTRVCDYTNLVYACVWCNSRKTDLIFPDPIEIDYRGLIWMQTSGEWKGLNDEGKWLVH